MSVSDVSELIEANFRSQIHVVHSFLQQVNKNKRTNIIILGSTSAYEAGAGTVIYGAAKAGMLAFVKALNKEYIETDIRLWFISTGTLANEMGAKVPNQDPNSLLDPALVAKRIIEAVTDESNLWEPEITIRRRHIKLVN
jgi:short-subunit dehydrogenase